MYKIKKKGRKSKNFNIMYSALTTELTRSNFKRIDLKGEGNKYYFSFIDKLLNVELCLEPCMNGFEVAMYNLNKATRFPDLIGKKICTNLKELIFKKEEDVYKKNPDKELPKELLDKLRTTELYYGTLERSERAWDKALAIAKKLYRIKRNEQRLRDWKLVKDSEEAAPKGPLYPPSTPHSPPPSAPGYPPYTTTPDTCIPDTWKTTAANTNKDLDDDDHACTQHLPSS